jgi:hypothetical protein
MRSRLREGALSPATTPTSPPARTTLAAIPPRPAGPVDWRRYLPAGAVVPDGWLGEKFRRYAMELGTIPPPADTIRLERRVSLDLPAETINARTLKGWGFDRRKVELQALFMRELDALDFLLERPIPSVGHTLEHAPIWVPVRLRFPTRASRRDVENLRTLIAKSLGDAFTGPEWTGRPGTPDRRRAHRRLRVNLGTDARPRWIDVTGGWLNDDGERDWLLDMDIDTRVGAARIDVRIVWDEPAP